MELLNGRVASACRYATKPFELRPSPYFGFNTAAGSGDQPTIRPSRRRTGWCARLLPLVESGIREQTTFHDWRIEGQTRRGDEIFGLSRAGNYALRETAAGWRVEFVLEQFDQ